MNADLLSWKREAVAITLLEQPPLDGNGNDGNLANWQRTDTKGMMMMMMMMIMMMMMMIINNGIKLKLEEICFTCIRSFGTLFSKWTLEELHFLFQDCKLSKSIREFPSPSPIYLGSSFHMTD